MKINPVSMNKIQNLYNKQKSSRNNTKNKKRDDKINISNKAKDIKQLEKSLENTAEIRNEKVKQLKTAIKNGNYQIEPQKIAEKILSQSQE